MKTIDYIWYDFFMRLRKRTGMPLDISQFHLLRRSLMAGVGWESREALYQLCRTLWLMDLKHQGVFNELFDLTWSALRQPVDTVSRRTEHPPQKESGLQEKSSGGKMPEEVIRKPIKNSEKIEPPPVLPKPSPKQEGAPKAVYLELYQPDIRSDEEVAGGSSPAETPSSWRDHNFIFSDRYLPIRTRKLQQRWRYLRRKALKIPGHNPDIAATVESIARRGVFSNFVYEKEVHYQRTFHFLIDHQGSMAAYETLAEQVVDTFSESLTGEELHRWYFYNYPGDHLFRDRAHREAVPLNEWLRSLQRQPSAVFIISDGGAARGSINEQRLDATHDFIEKQLRPVTSHILWLNPLPRGRWYKSSAQLFANWVAMLPLSAEGLRELPKALKSL